MLVDVISVSQMLFFIDSLRRYNQIKMEPSDAEKTVFWTPLDNLHYTVKPFGLKNAGATY